MSQRIFELIDQEKKRQFEGLAMIPSENYVSGNVLKAVGSILIDKYSEGYSGARYYAGNSVIDEIEKYTQELANKVFGTVHANVQPYSGSPANLAVSLALVQPGETLMGLSLSSGGHLTHGSEASFTSKLFNAVRYGVTNEGKIAQVEVYTLAKEHQPKLIWVGGTAYPYILEWEKFASVAAEVGAYLVADISHIAGLIATGEHPSPVEYVDVITTTTHKTLRGPRGAMILVTKKGLEKDPELIEKINKAVFPGLQGGPHDNTTAAIAVALEEVLTPEFKEYTRQVINNAKVLAEELGTTTENHLLLWDLSKHGYGLGYQAHIALEAAGIYVNKNSVPGQDLTLSAFYPNGIRLGTPALTSRGMKEEEMKKIAKWILEVVAQITGHDLPKQQEDRREFIKNFRNEIKNNQKILTIKEEIREFTKKYPIPGLEV